MCEDSTSNCASSLKHTWSVGMSVRLQKTNIKVLELFSYFFMTTEHTHYNSICMIFDSLLILYNLYIFSSFLETLPCLALGAQITPPPYFKFFVF